MSAEFTEVVFFKVNVDENDVSGGFISGSKLKFYYSYMYIYTEK